MILIFEMTCLGRTHVSANASLIKTISLAFPSEPVRFLADAGHIAAVKGSEILDLASNLAFQEVEISQHYRGHPDIVSMSRLYDEWKIIRGAVRNVSRDQRCLIVFLSATPTAIVAAQVAVKRFRRSLIQVVFHGNLHAITGWRTRNPLLRQLDLRSILARSRNSGTRFIVLEPAIKAALADVVPEIRSRVDILPFPVPQIAASFREPSSQNEPVRFGFVGGASRDKGFEVFLELANALKGRWGERVEFHLIGRVFPQYEDVNLDNIVRAAPADLATSEQYFAAIQALDYTIFPFQPGYYDFSPSGALLDSIACRRPFFAYRTPVVEALLEEFGELGTVCGDWNELLAAVESAINCGVGGVRAGQEEALDRARAARSPENLAPIFHDFSFPAD